MSPSRELTNSGVCDFVIAMTKGAVANLNRPRPPAVHVFEAQTRLLNRRVPYRVSSSRSADGGARRGAAARNIDGNRCAGAEGARLEIESVRA